MKKKIVVVGAGFAGISFIQKIDFSLYDVTLIDKLNHHQFQPLFYQVASSQIEPSSISFPIRNIFRKIKNLHIIMSEVLQVNSEENKLICDYGTLSYDILVLALGGKTQFYNNKSIESQAFTLKSTYDAIRIRNHILELFEEINRDKNIKKAANFNFVIVGGGATGVETAGAFAEIKKFILPKDFKEIPYDKIKIYLIEGGKSCLGNMSLKAQKYSEIYLKKLGVEIIYNELVTDYKEDIVYLKSGSKIPSKTLIWAAGITANQLKGFQEEQYSGGNRLICNRNNLVTGETNIYALGDMCYMKTPKYPKGHPQVANVAINQAKNLAKNLNKLSLNKQLKDFEYKDLGSMATIGKNKAVVDFSFIQLKGYIAWLIWMFLHLMLILSVRNKLVIFINWAWNYFKNDSSLRLILKSKK
ncbi:MAG: NAD(P)/FAD-dependent oxidoreductase [Flavobacteriia bacterium]|nr:NAD(P)/FAD-dependent oxidoreductase [Flavobacteriia bacterium]